MRGLSAGVEVGRLRMLGAVGDTPGARAVIGTVVGAADLDPPGLPPSAIVVIRRLEDEAPGRLTVLAGAAKPDPEWERSLREEISRCAASAARPIAGFVPTSANAVLFADRAELVACLVLDLVDGVAEARWWWERIHRRLAPSLQASEVLAQEPMVLPPVLQLLADRGQAAHVIAALTIDEANALVSAMVESYRVNALDSLLSRLGHSDPGPPVLEPPPQVQAPPVSPPWERWVIGSTVPEWLEPEQQLLLGIGMMLHRRAAAVNELRFGEEVTQWMAAQSSRAVDGQPSSDQPAVPGSEAVRTAVRSGAEPSPADIPVEPMPLFAPQRQHAESVVPEPPPPRVRPREDVIFDPGDQGENGRTVSEDVRSDATRHSNESVDVGADGAVETELGGVMYLVNLLRMLDLPACFDPDWRLGTEVGGWGLVHVIGRGLTSGEADGDVIWELLGYLAHDRREWPIGGGVSTDIPYVLPRAWWDELDAEATPVRWAARGGARRTWSEAGFVITDDPVGDAAPASRPTPPGHSVSRRGPFDAAPLGSPRAGRGSFFGAGLSRWLALAMPAIVRRLCLVLAVVPDDIEYALLARPALVHTTRTQVDMSFPRDAASVAVRRAGLDQDPGWVPDLGRVVSYHFG